MPFPQTPSPLLTVIAALTYNAAWFSGATHEAQIQAAINAAATDGALYVFIPANMVPFNGALVTFNTAIRMLVEGGNPATYDVRAYGSTLSGAFSGLPSGNGTIFVPDNYVETIMYPLNISGSISARVEVMAGAQITIGPGGQITLLNNGVWQHEGGVINVTKTSGDAISLAGKTSRFTFGQLNYTGVGGTTNALVFVGAQFCRVDGGAIQNFPGTGILFGRTGQAAGTINNRATVEFINNCGSLVTYASGVSGTDATPFCEGNRAYVNLASVFTTAGVTFGDNGTLHDSEFNEFHGDVHDTSVGGLVPVIFNDGQYCFYDGSVFTNNGAVRCTFNAAAKFNIVRCANIGTATNINGAGLFQNTLLSENIIQAVGINSSTWSPIRIGNSAAFQAYAGDNATAVSMLSCHIDNFIHIGDNSRQIFLDSGTSFATQLNGLQETSVALVSGATPAINALAGTYFTLAILSNIAVTIAVPSNPPGANLSQEITIAIRNSSGGALTTPPTFNTGANGFKFAGGSIVNPTNGTQVVYKWRWDNVQSLWYLLAVSTDL
jgi:hypothetical protein